MPSTIKDPRTGVNREISEGYTPSNIMPGATTIPSHDGDYGKQIGVDVNTPLEFVIDPDYKDGGIVVDPKKVGDINAIAGAIHGSSVTEKFRTIANQQIETPQPQQVMKETTPTKQNKRKKEEVPQPQPVIQTNNQMDGIDLAKMMKYLMDAMPKAPPIPEEEPPAPTPAPPQPEKSVKEAVPEPNVEVTFQTKDGARVITQFHEVIIDQSTVALVFDSRFRFGSRYIPAETPEDSPLTLTIQPHKKIIKAHYFNQMFRFMHWDFMILIAAEE